jgi:transforming growth factor-beta-induced protein
MFPEWRRIMTRYFIAIFAIAGALTLGGTLAFAGDCGAGAPMAKAEKHSKQDIVDIAVSSGSFNTLVEAVKAAGLVETLKGDGPFTVFAPTDAAFAAVPQETLSALLADKEALTKVLTYHVVSGKVPASKAVTLDWAPTVNGQAARIEIRDGNAYIDGAKIVKTDIMAANGIIHVIDKVILPRKDIVDTAVEAGAFSTLVTAVQTAGLVDTLKGEGPFTVFAPSDSAFANLPEGTVENLLKDKTALQSVLTYHVIPGRVLSSDLPAGATKKVQTVNGQMLTVSKDEKGNVMVDGAQVANADIITGNGVIHVIDSVVLPNASN